MRITKTLGALVFVCATVRAEAPAIDVDAPMPTPFPAWVNAARVEVFVTPLRDAALLGLLSRGDSVTVLACVPDCATTDAWASLEPSGYVRLGDLVVGAPDATARALAPSATFTYGRVIRERALIYASPDRSALRVGSLRRDDELAFRPDASLEARGWRQRARGGFVAMSDVRTLVPSLFEGVHRPSSDLVFTRRATTLTRDDGSVRAVDAHAVFALLSVVGSRVRVEGGTLPRAHLRIARARVRPSGVRVDERWVHVNLSEQVLTAYDGDDWVFATLVSSGRDEHPTSTGRFRVTRKSVHEDMHGPPGDPYTAEQVPHIMYFHEGMALHGAYWHDAFGTQASHGCVNMAPRDAAWLFTWSAPELPPGWHTILPLHARLEALRVFVARR